MENKEILTLQFGHYANFIGTHWWNIQEQGFDYNSTSPDEINHDSLYREGVTSTVIDRIFNFILRYSVFIF